MKETKEVIKEGTSTNNKDTTNNNSITLKYEEMDDKKDEKDSDNKLRLKQRNNAIKKPKEATLRVYQEYG